MISGTAGRYDIAYLRGLLAPCILLVLAEAPRHGYQLIDPLKTFGFDWSGPGQIYHELRKLAAADLVRSTWEQSGGPARRVYEPTDAGLRVLAAYVQEITEVARRVGDLIVQTESMALDGRAQNV